MSRPKQLISMSDRYEYLIDKIEVTLSSKYIYCRSEDFNSEVRFRDKEAPIHKEAYRGKILKVDSHAYIFTRYMNFNLNRVARSYLINHHAVSISLSRSDLAHDTNFIPAGYRQFMKAEKLSVAQLRTAAMKHVLSEIGKAAHQLILDVHEHTGRHLEISDIRTSILNVEINYDLVLTPSFQMARIPRIVKGFNEAADRLERGFHNRNGQLRGKPNENFVQKEISFSTRDRLVAKIYERDAIVNYACYLKEDGVYGSLNRCEARFRKDALRKILGGRTFKSESEFETMLNELSRVVFRRIYPILSFHPRRTDGVPWKKVRILIQQVFPSCAEAVYALLRKDLRISTSKFSNATPKAARSRIASLAKAKILFKKIRRSTYELDISDLSQISARFYAMKHAHRQQQIERRKLLN